jgi:hypothetical protein
MRYGKDFLELPHLERAVLVFGWSSAQIAMEYIKDAEQKKIANGAMHLVVGNVA